MVKRESGVSVGTQGARVGLGLVRKVTCGLTEMRESP